MSSPTLPIIEKEWSEMADERHRLERGLSTAKAKLLEWTDRHPLKGQLEEIEKTSRDHRRAFLFAEWLTSERRKREAFGCSDVVFPGAKESHVRLVIENAIQDGRLSPKAHCDEELRCGVHWYMFSPIEDIEKEMSSAKADLQRLSDQIQVMRATIRAEIKGLKLTARALQAQLRQLTDAEAKWAKQSQAHAAFLKTRYPQRFQENGRIAAKSETSILEQSRTVAAPPLTRKRHRQKKATARLDTDLPKIEPLAKWSVQVLLRRKEREVHVTLRKSQKHDLHLLAQLLLQDGLSPNCAKPIWEAINELCAMRSNQYDALPIHAGAGYKGWRQYEKPAILLAVKLNGNFLSPSLTIAWPT